MANFRKLVVVIMLMLSGLAVATNGVSFAWADGNGGTNTETPAATSGNTQMFSKLTEAGKNIFSELRELIYVVAGFGIIAVGVGGIFGNLNWKWLGAIIISLVVIATAGELLTAMTGSSHGFGGSYGSGAHGTAEMLKTGKDS